MRQVWLSPLKSLEIMKPQVDDRGYDLVLEANKVLRHIQLKTTFKGSTVNRFKINMGLCDKPGGCVVVLQFDEKTLKLGPFFWFGGKPGKRLPDLKRYKTAKHSKGNAQGVKSLRPKIKVVPRSAFDKVDSIEEIACRLFGATAGENGKAAR